MTPSTDPFLELRRHFPILGSTTYLISNSLGAMPAEVPDELERYVDSWRHRGVRAWHEGWWEMPVEVGDLLAPILGVAPGSVSMQPNVTLAVALFLSSLSYRQDRKRIVVSEHDFPSVRYLLAGEERRGAELVVVPSRNGLTVEPEDLLAAIDERTLVVPISHVLFRTAAIQDAEAIAEHCRRQGALLLLDVYQSAGTMPLELEAWGVDAAVGGCLKWLCGGPGNAFLWVRGGLDAQLEPAITGWQSHVEPFAFSADHERVEAGAWRYLTGTPAIPALHAAIPGLRRIAELDLAAVRGKSVRLTTEIAERAVDAGFEVFSPSDPELRGGTVTVAHPRSRRLAEGLLEREILCDHRPGAGIRLSPHFYNTAEECALAIDTLAELRDALPD